MEPVAITVSWNPVYSAPLRNDPMKSMFWSGLILVTLSASSYLVLQHEPSTAQERVAPSKLPIAEFEEYLSNSKLTGVFTIDGKPLEKLEAETYEIKSAKKLEGYDSLWEIIARIKYGDKDIEVPVEINVEWVGRTPVMVMDSMAIPGLGTFSARVLFHDKKYSGTWKHDSHGGHLFGRVEKMDAK